MYFSLIRMRRGHEREAARSWSDNFYAEHQWLWRFFATDSGAERDFVFRQTTVGGIPQYYVVSARRPEGTGGCDVRVRSWAPTKVAINTPLGAPVRVRPRSASARRGTT